MTASGRALLVVEPTFLDEHVGVLRVLAHYHGRLTAQGMAVDFAVPIGGRLMLLDEPSTTRAVERLSSPRGGTAVPTWTSAGGWAAGSPPVATPGPVRPVEPLSFTGPCRSSSYAVSVITNPWLCDRPMPTERFTHGIVYDLVPNLLLAHALDLGAPYLGFGFAGAHHRGYAFYADNVDEVMCISESTLQDFLTFYGDQPMRTVVDIPFTPDDTSPVNDRWDAARGTTAQLLLVNALDLRKNILGLQAALSRVALDHTVHLSVVGRERMPLEQAERVLGALADAGVTIDWYRGASDSRLMELYATTDGLLFPSLYEGLGLPILEAQSAGLPTVSSDSSSCREINLNRSLLVDPHDVDQLGLAITRVIERDTGVLAGAGLRREQRAWLGPRSAWTGR